MRDLIRVLACGWAIWQMQPSIGDHEYKFVRLSTMKTQAECIQKLSKMKPWEKRVTPIRYYGSLGGDTKTEGCFPMDFDPRDEVKPTSSEGR